MIKIKILRGVTRFVLFVLGKRAGGIKPLQVIFKWIAISCVPKHSVVVDINGYKLNLFLNSEMFCGEATSILFGNGYEVETTKAFKTIVKEGMYIVDIGAHIGYYTVLASRLVGNNGKVWAIEPEPNSLGQLMGNLELNQCRNVQVIPKALGEETKKGCLYLYGKFSGEHSLINISGNGVKTLNVDVVKLDDCVSGKIDILKIDVDGGEMGVLKGAGNLLKNPSICIFTEIWKKGLEKGGYTCQEYLSLLAENGFNHLYLLSEKECRAKLLSYKELIKYLEKYDGANLLCSKNSIDI